MKIAQKGTVVLIIAVLLAMVVAWGLLPRANSDPVSVRFVGYRQSDVKGFNEQYTWAWFAFDNRSSNHFSCRLRQYSNSPITGWIEMTNAPSLRTGLGKRQTQTNSIMLPGENVQWRCVFEFEEMQMPMQPPTPFAKFMDGLHLERYGFKAKPWRWKGRLFEVSVDVPPASK